MIYANRRQPTYAAACCQPEIDFHSDTYKDAYSRINAIVIEGEQAQENYIRLAELLNKRMI